MNPVDPPARGPSAFATKVKVMFKFIFGVFRALFRAALWIVATVVAILIGSTPD